MILRLAFTLLVGLSLSFGSLASSFPDKYDDVIKQSAKRYLPGVKWQLLKAQLYQESRMDPNAVSPVGAEGVAQFMPATWQEISAKMGYSNVSPRVAKYAIPAAAYYMGSLRKTWSSPRPHYDRLKLAAASYNAGKGNVIKSQRLCDNKVLYDEIVECLPKVTGKHSEETFTYVKRIWEYYGLMTLK